VNQGIVLIVDDKENIREVLSAILGDEGYKVLTAGNAGEALEILASASPDAVISDIKMPGTSGLQLQESIRRMDPELPVVLITAFGSIDSAVEAIKRGAYDYLTKPIDHERLKMVLKRAVEIRRYATENRRFRRELENKYRFESMIGSSPRMQKVFERIRAVSGTLSTVLILGESGTGKELVAKAIHYHGQRKDKPLVDVNCSALSEGLLESELFGHEKGAYTGAASRKIGRFESAHQGTLFLDEVGELSPSLQVKLLRVLQERRFERVGGSEPIRSDFRLIAATNRDLKVEAAQGRFREDLFYRLSVITIRMPPLRERKEDIPLLINHFMKKVCEREQRSLKTFTSEALEALLNHSWPGNVRELENCIERIMIVSCSDRIGIADLTEEIEDEPGTDMDVFEPPYVQDTLGLFGRTEGMDLHEREKELILDALMKAGWNKARAAKLLNIHRRTIYNRIKKYQLDPNGSNSDGEVC